LKIGDTSDPIQPNQHGIKEDIIKVDKHAPSAKSLLIMGRTNTYAIALLSLLTSCYSFDKEVAIDEFRRLKPNCEIIETHDYECDGTFGECWYVKFKYKYSDSVSDTTLQYWKVENKWIVKD